MYLVAERGLKWCLWVSGGLFWCCSFNDSDRGILQCPWWKSVWRFDDCFLIAVCRCSLIARFVWETETAISIPLISSNSAPGALESKVFETSSSRTQFHRRRGTKFKPTNQPTNKPEMSCNLANQLSHQISMIYHWYNDKKYRTIVTRHFPASSAWLLSPSLPSPLSWLQLSRPLSPAWPSKSLATSGSFGVAKTTRIWSDSFSFCNPSACFPHILVDLILFWIIFVCLKS